jgi:hypothetical protein
LGTHFSPFLTLLVKLSMMVAQSSILEE